MSKTQKIIGLISGIMGIIVGIVLIILGITGIGINFYAKILFAVWLIVNAVLNIVNFRNVMKNRKENEK